jgi:Flp pilus assembly protein TadB
MSDKNGGKQFWEGLKDAGKTIVFFAIFIALFYPGISYVYDLFHDEEKRKPKPGEAVSLLLLIAILAVFTVLLYPVSLWLYGFTIVCWIGISLFLRLIKFLWK